MIKNFQKETNNGITSQWLYPNIWDKTPNLKGNHEYSCIYQWATLHNVITLKRAIHEVSFDTSYACLDQLSIKRFHFITLGILVISQVFMALEQNLRGYHTFKYVLYLNQTTQRAQIRLRMFRNEFTFILSE
jgi:hypothetical protein